MRVEPAKDYFAVLGVCPHADPAVIKAAYRALAKKYHPDRQSGEAARARMKFQEVQEAYELLQSEDRLKHYLRAREQFMQRGNELAQRRYRPPIRLFLDDRWDHLVREHPDIGRHHARFGFVSHKLAQEFKLTILGTHKVSRFNKIALRMERRFYRRYFSYHRDIQVLARRLAARRRRHGLRDLAREIRGRRLLMPRYKQELLARFEAKYLRPAGPVAYPMRTAQIAAPKPAHSPRRWQAHQGA